MNENKPSAKVGNASRGLESALSTSEAILHHVIAIQSRLAEMNVRLHGEQPEVACESQDGEAPPDGIMGQLYAVHQATLKRCDSVDDWLSRIENTA